MKRIFCFFFVIIPSCGFSALQWIWRFVFHGKTMNLQDHNRVLHFFGILDPDLDLVWSHATDFHTRKDVGAEWGKLDVQRAVKFLCMIILVLAAIGAVEALVIAALILI